MVERLHRPQHLVGVVEARPGGDHIRQRRGAGDLHQPPPRLHRRRPVGRLQEPPHLDPRLQARVAALQADVAAAAAGVGDLDVQVRVALAALHRPRVRHHLVDAPLPTHLVGAGEEALVPGVRPGRGVDGELEAVRHLRVVLHPPPHPRHLRRDGDAVAPQLLGGADAGAQQRRGGGVGAEGHDHRVGGEPLRPLGPDDLHGAGDVPLQHHPVDGDAGAQGQVRALEGGVEVAVGGGLADAVDHVQGDRPDPDGAGGVVVVDPPVAGGEGGLCEPLLQLEPVGAGVAADRDRPLRAVPGGVAEVAVGLDRPEPRQPAVPPPAVHQVVPLVVVLGVAAQGDRPVRDRRPPHHPAAGDVHDPRGRPRPRQVPPVVGLLDDPVGVGELRRPRPRPVVGAHLEEGDLVAPALRQAGRGDAAGGAGAADHDPHGLGPA